MYSFDVSLKNTQFDTIFKCFINRTTFEIFKDLSKEYRSHSLNDLWTMRFIA